MTVGKHDCSSQPLSLASASQVEHRR